MSRKTSSSRFSRAIRAVAIWCRRARHLSIEEQCKTLGYKLRGHFNYYGIQGNVKALARFRHAVLHVWRKWLGRRNQRGMTWQRFNEICKRHQLPLPRTMHWTTQRSP